MVSDEITDEDMAGEEPPNASPADAPAPDAPEKSGGDEEAMVEEAVKTDPNESGEAGEPKKSVLPPPLRSLKGVMRVGVLAKGLLLHDCLRVDLVLLCSDRPSRSLLRRVAGCLPKHLNVSAPGFAPRIPLHNRHPSRR